MSNKSKNPNSNLESIIKDSNLQDLAMDYSEIAIDGILDDGILKEIPAVGTIVGMIKFGNSINKHITTKRIYKFLFELSSIPKEKRLAKINEINESKKYQSSVGEMIFEILDKIESDGKPGIIGKLFASFIQEKIDFNTFLRLSHIVKSLFYFDLLELKDITNNDVVMHSINDSISTSGLVETDMVYINENDTEKKHQTTLTDLGRQLINNGMK